MRNSSCNLSFLGKQNIIFLLFFLNSLFCILPQKTNAADSDDQLLAEYVQSKGANIIAFDASNIKQYWIDHSVVSRNSHIEIVLNENESIPLKIQLANVNETQDCKVEIISETKDISFSVQNNESTILSSSKSEDDFLSYSVSSSVFHLEDTPKMNFELKFASKETDILSIKKIILSFSDNKETSFLIPPGEFRFTSKNIKTSSIVKDVDSNSFSITGARTVIFSAKKIFVQDNTLSCSMTIKNISENTTNLYIGYGAYSQDGTWFNSKNYPAKPSCEVLTVVSALEGNDKIIVNAYSDWFKGSFLALDAKDDLSDIPSNTFVNGTITEIKKLENEQAEITLNKPLQTEIKEGTKVRVHGPSGAYLYTVIAGLHPGEERVFTATIKKDNNFLEYSPKAFSKGVYYVVPIILSYSLDANKENTILISDYTISY